jgi:HEAT repeat protein
VLRRDYGQSRYLTDAKVLEADVKRTPPQDIVDDEIKILAVNAMRHQDPERATATLEGVLSGTNSLGVKRRALYILALTNHPRAHQVLLGYAKGSGNPDLQLTAIQYLAANQDRKTTADELRQIYDSTTDTRVRSAIISAYTSSGSRNQLVSVVSTADAPMAIRQQALNGLTGILSPQDLWQIYEKEPNRELRLQIIRSFGGLRALDQLNQVLRTEKDPELRRQAIRSLGNLKTEQTGTGLVELYGKETDAGNKRAIIQALSAQNNVDGLIQIARAEKSPELMSEIVRRLSDMAARSKAAADYLMELIKR